MLVVEGADQLAVDPEIDAVGLPAGYVTSSTEGETSSRSKPAWQPPLLYSATSM